MAFRMWTLCWLTLFVAALSLPATVYHVRTHGALSWLQLALAVFQAVNTWVCLCEWSLFFLHDRVQREYKDIVRRCGALTMPTPIFLFERTTLGELLSLSYWTRMWAAYSVIDHQYAERTSWGFWVDTGNGLVTFVPTLLVLVGASAPLLDASTFGLVCVVAHYQELYGTLVYFASYVFNHRYVGHPRWHIALVVVSNAIWVVMPLLGLYAGVRCVRERSYAVFGIADDYKFHAYF